MTRDILIQQIYPDTEGVKMLELTRSHHEAYCTRHGLDYWCEIANPLPDYDVRLGSWGKVRIIQKAMQDGYEDIVWLDADTIIVDLSVNLCKAIELFKIGACWHRIPQLNHWNVGALYIHNSIVTRKFIDDWLAAYPPTDGWLEQGIFNRMGRASNVVSTLSDKWNATIDVSMVPDAVVLGFHGQGNTAQRYEKMCVTLERLFPASVAVEIAEAVNG